MKGAEGVTLYKNVEVEWIRGRSAVMTVYKGENGLEEGDILEENINLTLFETSDDLHALFERYGFEKHEEGFVNVVDGNNSNDGKKKDENEGKRRLSQLIDEQNYVKESINKLMKEAEVGIIDPNDERLVEAKWIEQEYDTMIKNQRGINNSDDVESRNSNEERDGAQDEL